MLHRPERIRDIIPPYDSPEYIDAAAHKILAERLRHLPSNCRCRQANLTLSDLGFTPYDWVAIDEAQQLSELHQQAASVYLASLLLGKVFVESLNCHPEAYPTVGFFPAQAFNDIACNEGWHSHYGAANTYVNYIRAAKDGIPGPKFLDGLYRKTVNPAQDFSHGFATHHPVRFHVYPGPLHAFD